MGLVFLILFILATLFYIYNHSSAEEKIDAYIKERGGTFVSKKREYFDLVSLFRQNTSAYKLVYYDKHKELREVLLRISYNFVDFIDDHKVHTNDKECFIEKESDSFSKQEKDVKFVDYSYKSDKGLLVIKQSFYQPNKGEKAFLNDETAPDGKYKIGFMNYIIIENGKVKGLTMT